ncbi:MULTISPECIES: type II toxin-antitoxin system RelE/ParE family toxin [Vibrio]|jgi:mRNA-degrading endonuclease RelE of RelBE toxin-antitoxin system|uniref:type II toxin-antitoxin system RelE/ParE family toxin n=1 Tax=Vibrio TaxID=662 RepID=UPI00036FD8AF|nr:type II toxin-antitoxin system RelE/ParE family toxin [Vibrio tasmaniensis]OEF60655.1 hypothetical protein A152_23340 [Vibrio tasmaniensis 1F-187]OEF70263.1 hypothetical protein A162_21665 [Vibrio tasmaniensis 1F-155]PMO75493.1 hypothetical protein BCT01_17345 [Vibrio tasmaniensis]
MTHKVEIQYTETFENSLNDSIDHLTQWNDEKSVIEGVESLLDAFEENVSHNPDMYSRCSELVGLGVTSIREFKKSGFRLFYEVNNGTVIGLVLLRQKQDISMALVDYCIIHK